MKPNEQYFSDTIFTWLQMVIRAGESVDKIPKCDHSNERY